MALFGPSEKTLKKDSQIDYEKGVALKGDSRKEQAYRMRIALRARSHIDKLFVEAATKAEKFNEVVVLNVSQGKAVPDHPTASEHMKLLTSSGEVWSYLPKQYAQLVFKYGMQYQSMEITGPAAISNVQKIADAIAFELKLEHSLGALGFLKEQLEDEGVNVDAEIAALNDEDEAL